MNRQCSNETCTQTATRKFCSRDCQLAARREGAYGRHRRTLPDIWVGMDAYRLIVERAEQLDITVRDLIVNLIEAEFDWDDRLDFGDWGAA